MKDFTIKAELLQEDVAAWHRVYVTARPVGLAEQRQWQLQAAMAAGWVESPAVVVEKRIDLETGEQRTVYLYDGIEVGKMRPWQVFQLGQLCERAYAEATTVPDPKN